MDIVSLNLKQFGVEELFEIQKIVVPILRRIDLDQDVMVCAPTGSGKTLSYVIPIVESLQKFRVKRLRALVIVPTRDLVEQVKDVFEAISKNTNLKIMGTYGSQRLNPLEISGVKLPPNFPMEHAVVVDNHSNVDILISTPGRLLDLLPFITFDFLEYLVLDEADMVLSTPFSDGLHQIMQSISVKETINYEPHRPLKLLFSATLTQKHSESLYDPMFISCSSMDVVPVNLKEYVLNVSRYGDKLEALQQLLQKIDCKKVIVFTNTVGGARRLSTQIANSKFFSRELPQQKRDEILKNFEGVLVASDVIARGIDLPKVDMVVNFDVPMSLAQYVHRVGRTARAMSYGTAVTICCLKDEKLFLSLNRKTEIFN